MSKIKLPAWYNCFSQKYQYLPTQSTESLSINGFLITQESKWIVLIHSCCHLLKFCPICGIRWCSVHLLKRNVTPILNGQNYFLHGLQKLAFKIWKKNYSIFKTKSLMSTIIMTTCQLCSFSHNLDMEICIESLQFSNYANQGSEGCIEVSRKLSIKSNNKWQHRDPI